MHHAQRAAALAAVMALSPAVRAQWSPDAHDLGAVTITGSAPTSLPAQVPATVEGMARAQVDEAVNAFDSEDTLKYLPSLLVRKRFIGDYNHAVLSSRASGTGNSARSAVYADGMLLSNFLGNGVGGLSFPPRWGLVTPEEIERVDVLYGPFSAAYPGNSLGAVLEFRTRMPTRFEAHGRVAYAAQPFDLDGVRTRPHGLETSASLGNRSGDWSWFAHASRTGSQGQPLTFATRLASSGTAGGAGVPVSGAVLQPNSANQPWLLLGSGTAYRSTQDHLKLKLAWDGGPALRASVTAALWRNAAGAASASFLRDAAGATVSAGPVQVDGRSFAALTGADFPLTRESQRHSLLGASLRSDTHGAFDWQFSASRYAYDTDTKRQNAAANPLTSALAGGPGTIADGAGSGWDSLAARGTWRPAGAPHVVDAGLQQDRFTLAYRTASVPGDWRGDAPGALQSEVGGRLRLASAWVQDSWRFAPDGHLALGWRMEHWSARDGRTQVQSASPALDARWPARDETHASPKAALSWQWQPSVVLRAAVGRAVRFPTVAELYGATSSANAQFVNDPALRPERAWSGELSAIHDGEKATLRATWFVERLRDALYTQTLADPVANRNVSRVQNVGRIATQGLELVANASGLPHPGVDLMASLTWADSVIRENAGFVSLPGDTLGKQQPNIPRWRASALATWRFATGWSAATGLRYSGRQYRTLDNSDSNGFAYMGVSRFLLADARLRWQATREVALALGIDNLGRQTSWNFHPYPQRSYNAELRIDL